MEHYGSLRHMREKYHGNHDTLSDTSGLGDTIPAGCGEPEQHCSCTVYRSTRRSLRMRPLTGSALPKIFDISERGIHRRLHTNTQGDLQICGGIIWTLSQVYVKQWTDPEMGVPMRINGQHGAGLHREVIHRISPYVRYHSQGDFVLYCTVFCLTEEAGTTPVETRLGSFLLYVHRISFGLIFSPYLGLVFESAQGSIGGRGKALRGRPEMLRDGPGAVGSMSQGLTVSFCPFRLCHSTLQVLHPLLFQGQFHTNKFTDTWDKVPYFWILTSSQTDSSTIARRRPR